MPAASSLSQICGTQCGSIAGLSITRNSARTMLTVTRERLWDGVTTLSNLEVTPELLEASVENNERIERRLTRAQGMPLERAEGWTEWVQAWMALLRAKEDAVVLQFALSLQTESKNPPAKVAGIPRCSVPLSGKTPNAGFAPLRPSDKPPEIARPSNRGIRHSLAESNANRRSSSPLFTNSSSGSVRMNHPRKCHPSAEVLNESGTSAATTGRRGVLAPGSLRLAVKRASAPEVFVNRRPTA